MTVTAVGYRGQRRRHRLYAGPRPCAYHRDEWVVDPGTGLDLAAPLKFNHAANLPFSDRGTGISFQPATAFAHSSNEPVQALGAGITLDQPAGQESRDQRGSARRRGHDRGLPGDAGAQPVVRGPELTLVPLRPHHRQQGSMVLRDAAGLVVDSLNYGGLVDPWAAEGYQAASGSGQSGCYVPCPVR